MAVDEGDLRIDLAQARAKLDSDEAVALDVVQPGAWDQIESSLFVKRLFGRPSRPNADCHRVWTDGLP